MWVAKTLTYIFTEVHNHPLSEKTDRDFNCPPLRNIISPLVDQGPSSDKFDLGSHIRHMLPSPPHSAATAPFHRNYSSEFSLVAGLNVETCLPNIAHWGLIQTVITFTKCHGSNHGVKLKLHHNIDPTTLVRPTPVSLSSSPTYTRLGPFASRWNVKTSASTLSWVLPKD